MESRQWPKVRYEDLEPRLHTGDVLLFHGASRRSRIIETVTGSEFSHVGMIVRPQSDRPPLLWHTDPRSVSEDVVDDDDHAGAQLNDLASSLRVMTSPGYGDTPFVRQLITEHQLDLDEEVLQTIATAERTAFPSLARILDEWMRGHLHLGTSERHMDCAELLALTYQRMGLLPSEPPPNAYAPRDFSAQHMKLRLLRGATLGPQLEVLWSGPALA